MKEEEDSSHPCVECEVPRELLLDTDQLMPALEIGFERFEENKLFFSQPILFDYSIIETIHTE